MMDIDIDYLKDYGFTDENIDNLLDKMGKEEIDLYNINCKELNCRNILYFLATRGIKNLYSIVYTSPRIFDYDKEEIVDRFNKYGNIEELVNLLNEDPNNLSLIDLI